VFSPRNLIIAGVVLIAIALGPSGHGLWWLIGFLWFLPHVSRRHLCGAAARCPGGLRSSGGAPATTQDVPGPVPDADHDRHVAFPEAR
jgi:hypothetical protein